MLHCLTLLAFREYTTDLISKFGRAAGNLVIIYPCLFSLHILLSWLVLMSVDTKLHFWHQKAGKTCRWKPSHWVSRDYISDWRRHRKIEERCGLAVEGPDIRTRSSTVGLSIPKACFLQSNEALRSIGHVLQSAAWTLDFLTCSKTVGNVICLSFDCLEEPYHAVINYLSKIWDISYCRLIATTVA